MTSTKPLTPREEAFCVAMCDPKCATPADALAAAGDQTGAANRIGKAAKMLSRPEIVERIRQLRDTAAFPAVMDATAVLNAWTDLWLADPAELVRPVRYACRHCHGTDHEFQWVDEREHALAVARVIEANASRPPKAEPRPLPAATGGFGYDRARPPVKGCYACGGDGDLTVVVADLETVSPRARRLYAGAKMGKYGIEIAMHDQAAALGNIAKYLGMFVERHRVGGDPDNPTPVPTAALPVDPIEASRIYAAIVGAGG